jgi:hypothetical protein
MATNRVMTVSNVTGIRNRRERRECFPAVNTMEDLQVSAVSGNARFSSDA